MKKTIGIILIAIGLSFIVFFVLNFFLKQKRLISPLPEKEGVNIIQITPAE